ncbi:MAG: TonB family protein [Acidobacteria bacterium]|nr:TonB family protein [Acidobacteriota bacterium]
MKPRLVVLFFLAAAVVHLAAQPSETLDRTAGVAELTNLAAPIYPPLARQARITGDVDVTVVVRSDGTVESARLLNGHPMLAVAALDSAKRSKFECRGCTEAVTSYALKYKFQIISRGSPRDCDSFKDQSPAPELDPSRHEVVVSGFAQEICDPAGTLFRVRSGKCWYLWRCGIRYGDP